MPWWRASEKGCIRAVASASNISCIATARAAQIMHGYNGATARACIATARAGRTMHRYGEPTVVTEHASQRREQSRLFLATAEQRQGQCMHRDEQPGPPACSLPIAWRHGLGLGFARCLSICIATARAGQTVQGYNGTTDQQVHASRRREQRRI